MSEPFGGCSSCSGSEQNRFMFRYSTAITRYRLRPSCSSFQHRTGQTIPSPAQSSRISTATGLRPRAVTPLEGALFAKQHGLLYVETSAKEGWHVVDAFEWTAREVLATVSRTELERRKVSSGHVQGDI